jgi:hypothetical protein
MVILISLLFIGCASMDSPELYHRINVAYDFDVTHCDSFAIVTAFAKGDKALSDAKSNAMIHGEELGGTHIVWLHIDHGEPTKVVAVIYKCLR